MIATPKRENTVEVSSPNGKIYLAPSRSTLITVINSLGITPKLEYIELPVDQQSQVEKYSGELWRSIRD